MEAQGGFVRFAREKHLLRLLLILALIVLLLAIGLNLVFVLASPSSAESAQEIPGDSQSAVVVEVETPAFERLPKNVTEFETVARQSVPGQGDRVGEAVYQVLDMMLESRVATSSYGRVEIFASPDDAEARTGQLIVPYTVRPEDLMLNGITEAKAGYTVNEGAYAVIWVDGDNCVMVKTVFRDAIPQWDRQVIRDQAVKLAERIDLYQRLGLEGVAAASRTGAEQ